MKQVFVVLFALGLAACVSTGTKVTEQQAAQFHRGVTTREQVIASIGAPEQSMLNNDGTRIDTYVHIQAHANAASYIPVVGLLAGGATGTNTSAVFTYDANGVLKTMSTGEGQTHVNTGLLNQQ